MSVKQLVLEMTPEARKELKEWIDFVESKEAELIAEEKAEISEDEAELIAEEKAEISEDEIQIGRKGKK